MEIVLQSYVKYVLVFTQFVVNCQKNYSLWENVTLDEMLEGFCEHFPFCN